MAEELRENIARKPPMHTFSTVMLLLLLASLTGVARADVPTTDVWQQAVENGRQAAEALRRCHRYVVGWLDHADPETGLIPRNLQKDRDIWNGKDSAADNYPFMVLTCALTDREMFEGRMLEMLRTEEKLTSRLDNLVDPYSFSKHDFYHDDADLDRMIFESSEYVKDGLMPITEWLGPSPWSDRMVGIIHSILEHAPVNTPGGRLPSDNVEVNGEMMQTLSRLYFMQADEKYLDAACRIADYYLLGNQHPTRDMKALRLRDHGCELISGLTEVYVACNFARPANKRAYQQPLHEMLDRILEVGVNADGQMYDVINPRSGKVLKKRLSDTWGYNYNGYYAVYLVDGTKSYQKAVCHALSMLNAHSRDYQKDSDSIADSVEGAINLLNREHDESAVNWVDHEIGRMFAIQRPDGVIEGWHGDGNFARTAILYALMKQQGVTLQPWRDDVTLGAVRQDGELFITLFSQQPWHGRIVFDQPRHKTYLHLPRDYPRINQFPEWFTIDSNTEYSVTIDKEKSTCHGDTLIAGLEVDLPSGKRRTIRIQP